MTERERHSLESHEDELNQIIAHYYQSLEQGEKPQPEKVLQAHPKFAEELKSFFLDLANFHSVLGQTPSQGFDGRRSSPLDNPADPSARPSIRQIGDYRLLEEIARGGMGVVYKAEQISLRRPVALKMILGGQLASKAHVDRFRREAMAAGGLQHSNIVSVHDVGEFEGNAYYTMDFVDGECLATRLREGPLAPRAAAQLLKKIALAIQFAHEQGILHRDLKPANVLIDREGEAHITDFGLAKSLIDSSIDAHELTATGQILGTPSYMSPEQAEAKHDSVSVASDIYSLGAILYACLSGRAPFVADSTVDTIRQVIEKEPVSIRLLSPQVPRDLETICLKCLSKEPHRRYSTASELAKDLERFLERRPVRARRVGLMQRGWKWCRRRPDIAALVALLFFGLVASLAAVSFWWQMAEYAKLDAQSATIEAKRHSYASLMREAQAIRLARQSGYRDEVWARLREASQMTDIEIDTDAIREEAVACLGDFVGLNPITIGGPALADTNDCALFLDEDRIAFAQEDGTIAIHSISQGKQTEIIPREGQPARAMAATAEGTDLFLVDNHKLERWSRRSDGRWGILWKLPASYSSLYMNLAYAKSTLAVISGSSIQLVDAEYGRVVRSLEPPRDYRFRFPRHGFLNVAFSPVDGLVAAADTPTSIFIWNTKNGELLHTISAPSTGDVRLEFSADGRYLIVGSDEGITSYRTDDFTQWSICRTGSVRAMTTSPSGDYILVQTRSGSVQMWNTVTQTNSAELSHPGSTLTIGTVAFSPTGTRFLSAGNNAIRIWRINEMPEKRILAGHSQAVQQVSFHPRQSIIASGGLEGRVKFWAYEDGVLVDEVDLQEPVISVAYSSDGRYFAASTDRTLRLWNVEVQGKSQVAAVPINPNGVLDLCFTPESSHVLTAGSMGVVAWEIEDNGPDRPLRLEKSSRVSGVGKCIDCSLDGEFIAFASPMQQLQLMRLEQSQLKTAFAFPHRYYANSVVADPLRPLFYAATKSGTIEVIDSATGEVVGSFDDRFHLSATSMAVSPNGEILATDQTPSTIGLYEVETQRRIFALGDEGAAINTIDWSSEGRHLAVGLTDGHIAIWDMGRILGALKHEQMAGVLDLFDDLPALELPREQLTNFEHRLETIPRTQSPADIADQILVNWGLSPKLADRQKAIPPNIPPDLVQMVREADGEVSNVGIVALTLTWDQLTALDARLKPSGFQLESIRPWRNQSVSRVAATWRMLSADTIFAANLTLDRFAGQQAEMKARSYQLIDLGGYLPDSPSDQERLYAIWRENNSRPMDQTWLAQEPADDVDPTFFEMCNSHRLIHRNVYFDANDQERYCELWNAVKNGPSKDFGAFVDRDLSAHRIENLKVPIRTLSIAQNRDRSKTHLSFVSRDEHDKSHTHYVLGESLETFQRVNIAMLATGHFPRCVCVYLDADGDRLVAAVWEK